MRGTPRFNKHPPRDLAGALRPTWAEQANILLGLGPRSHSFASSRFNPMETEPGAECRPEEMRVMGAAWLPSPGDSQP